MLQRAEPEAQGIQGLWSPNESQIPYTELIDLMFSIMGLSLASIVFLAMPHSYFSEENVYSLPSYIRYIFFCPLWDIRVHEYLSLRTISMFILLNSVNKYEDFKVGLTISCILRWL